MRHGVLSKIVGRAVYHTVKSLIIRSELAVRGHGGNNRCLLLQVPGYQKSAPYLHNDRLDFRRLLTEKEAVSKVVDKEW